MVLIRIAFNTYFEMQDGQNVYHVAAAEGQLVCLKYLCTVADKDLLLSKDKVCGYMYW